MVKRGLLILALGLGLLAVFAPLGVLAQTAGDDDGEWTQICRRLYNTHGYLPARCRAQLATETWETYCRRVYGTDAWTRRCASPTPTPTFDPIAYCRRIYGTDEWTRRCWNLVDPTATPEPTRERPTATFDPIAYCRRIYGTDEWTRRCLHLADPTRTPEPTRERPTSTPEPSRELPTRTAEPTRERPTSTAVVVTVVATLRGEPAATQAPIRVRP